MAKKAQSTFESFVRTLETSAPRSLIAELTVELTRLLEVLEKTNPQMAKALQDTIEGLVHMLEARVPESLLGRLSCLFEGLEQSQPQMAQGARKLLEGLVHMIKGTAPESSLVGRLRCVFEGLEKAGPELVKGALKPAAPIELQRLVHNSKELSTVERLLEVGVKDGDSLVLFVNKAPAKKTKPTSVEADRTSPTLPNRDKAFVPASAPAVQNPGTRNVKLVVQTLQGERLNISIESDAQVTDLMNQIARLKPEMPIRKQRLVFREQELD